MLKYCCVLLLFVFFFKQKTAYELRISDWSSDVCSSDLAAVLRPPAMAIEPAESSMIRISDSILSLVRNVSGRKIAHTSAFHTQSHLTCASTGKSACIVRSEEHTSELQSLMRISYAVFCLKKKNKNKKQNNDRTYY